MPHLEISVSHPHALSLALVLSAMMVTVPSTSDRADIIAYLKTIDAP
jgi:hypothetical protein